MPDENQEFAEWMHEAHSETVQSSTQRQPLAARMRPNRLKDVVGQKHILGEDQLLPKLISSNQFGNLFFYGPPGCGKTTLAEVIAKESGGCLVKLNAVLSNVAELKAVLKAARSRPERGTILFIDEIHRFNKAQQDLLLPDIEAGNLRLIGATTQSPAIAVTKPLLSRSQLFCLEALSVSAIKAVLEKALVDHERGLGALRIRTEGDILDRIAKIADGDLRRALNALETLALAMPVGGTICEDAFRTYASERHIRYDRNDDEHYDHASAFIKSVRGSDPDAALYWGFKMLSGGEDPLFLSRRLIILASEDIGLANSHALPVAIAAAEACERVGLPECELHLAHAILYLSTSPKSNSVTTALAAVKDALKNRPIQEVPRYLKDKHTAVGNSKSDESNYRYSHDYPSGISGQDYLQRPEKIYTPVRSGVEIATADRLDRWQQLKEAIRVEEHIRKSD